MKFKLSTSGRFYHGDEYQKELESLGFKFTPNDYKPFYKLDHEPEIEINTLEELIAFRERFGELILTDGEIEIYDNYRE
jgi:hypothetical protein